MCFLMARYFIDNQYSSELLEDVKEEFIEYTINAIWRCQHTVANRSVNDQINEKAHLSMKNRKTFQCTRIFLFKKG